MAFSLDGRLALVTGASGGIGGAVALALARAGADLVLAYSGHRDDAEAVAAAVTGLGRAATTVQADLGAEGAGRNLAERVSAAAGPVDVLVANAGAGVRRPWQEVDEELWAYTFAVNVTAVWQLTRALLPGMVERGFGRILFVSSVAAFNGGVVGPHYAASKAALHGLMHHLAPRVAGSPGNGQHDRASAHRRNPDAARRWLCGKPSGPDSRGTSWTARGDRGHGSGHADQPVPDQQGHHRGRRDLPGLTGRYQRSWAISS
jgi:NADP-dependent 3-hydroxy acid dehydrogenase YdfG